MKCPHCNGTGQLDAPSIGSLVLAARRASGKTQAEIAEISGLSRGQIANLETDRTDIPLKTLKRVADALGCSMRDLVPA